MGEESESYLLRLSQGATVLREVTLATPALLWTVANQTADGAAPGAVRVEVMQLSQRFGPGPAAQATFAL